MKGKRCHIVSRNNKGIYKCNTTKPQTQIDDDEDDDDELTSTSTIYKE
jgi:hypothetical protein